MKCKHCGSEKTHTEKLRSTAAIMILEEDHWEVYRCDECGRLTMFKPPKKR